MLFLGQYFCCFWAPSTVIPNCPPVRMFHIVVRAQLLMVSGPLLSLLFYIVVIVVDIIGHCFCCCSILLLLLLISLANAFVVPYCSRAAALPSSASTLKLTPCVTAARTNLLRVDTEKNKQQFFINLKTNEEIIIKTKKIKLKLTPCVTAARANLQRVDVENDTQKLKIKKYKYKLNLELDD